MADSAPKKQHVVSQVLLRRWVDVQGELSAFDRIGFREIRRGPGGIAYVENMIRSDPEAAEAMWAEVEQDLPEALDAVEAGPPFDDTTYVQKIKDCFALHWARSHTMVTMYNELLPHQLRKAKKEIYEEREWHYIFLELYGLYPAGPQARRVVDEYFAHKFDDVFRDGDFFLERMAANFDQAKDLVKRYDLEIGEAIEGEYVIGDNPALSVAVGHEGVGPLGGVPWNKADTILLPLGPRHVMGLRSGGHTWKQYQQDAVEKLNAVEIAGAYRHIAYRPESGLGNFVRTHTTRLSIPGAR